MAIEVETFSAPAYWASYLINGDASGLTDEEQATCDKWVESIRPYRIVSCEGEQYFKKFHDAFNVLPLAADCIDYIAHKVTVDESSQVRS